jgi:hypothetical protein
MTADPSQKSQWPELPYEAWKDTCDTPASLDADRGQDKAGPHAMAQSFLARASLCDGRFTGGSAKAIFPCPLISAAIVLPGTGKSIRTCKKPPDKDGSRQSHPRRLDKANRLRHARLHRPNHLAGQRYA